MPASAGSPLSSAARTTRRVPGGGLKPMPSSMSATLSPGAQVSAHVAAGPAVPSAAEPCSTKSTSISGPSGPEGR